MKVIVQFEDNDYTYEVPIKKLLPFLKVPEKDIENKIKEAIART